MDFSCAYFQFQHYSVLIRLNNSLIMYFPVSEEQGTGVPAYKKGGPQAP